LSTYDEDEQSKKHRTKFVGYVNKTWAFVQTTGGNIVLPKFDKINILHNVI
jgi:hypothetical protein